MNFAIGNALLANINRDPKRQREPFEPMDFMPHVRKEPVKPMSIGQSIGLVALLNAALGGVDARKAA